jgi:hypothetical protein
MLGIRSRLNAWRDEMEAVHSAVWNKRRELIDDRDLILSRVGANRDWWHCNGALLRRKLSDGRGSLGR